MKYLFLTLLLALAGTFPLSGADEIVTVTGSGKTEDAAVRSALNRAVEQKYGVSLASISRSRISSAESFSAVNNKENEVRISDDRIARDIRTASSGRITGYKVLALEKKSDTGLYMAALEVSFPGKYVVGDDPDALRRMAVAPFRSNMYNFSAFGSKVNASAWVSALTDALNVHLTQTRKFTMLDRKFDAETEAELARLNDPNAAPRDAVRFCQKLATDYLITGSVTFSNVQKMSENPYTGKLIMPAQTVFATVSYRVLLAATGQLKWADSVPIDGQYFYTSLSGGAVNDSADYAAKLICDGIISCILPYEIVGFNPDGTVIIGEGGKTFAIGEYLSVYNLGQDVADSRTGKVIDTAEVRVGMVQVIRQTEKLSYAVVVSGAREQMKVGARLRRDEFTRQAEDRARAAGTPAPQGGVVKTTPAGGVSVPF